MSFDPIRAQKRQLRDVLEAGVAHEEARLQREKGVLFEVRSSNGELFGLCTRTPDGRHLYTQPQQLEGIQVLAPMVVHSHANTQILVATLGSGLRQELRR